MIGVPVQAALDVVSKLANQAFSTVRVICFCCPLDTSCVRWAISVAISGEGENGSIDSTVAEVGDMVV